MCPDNAVRHVNGRKGTHVFKFRKPALIAVAVGALASLALLPTATAQAASSPSTAAVGVAAAPASTGVEQHVTTKAHWQKAIAGDSERGSGCYQTSYPSLAWRPTECVAAPKVLLEPRSFRTPAKHAEPETVGDGTDYSAQVSGLISQATGTFTDVSSNISEAGSVDGSSTSSPNSFTLQLNSQFFAGSPACSGSSDPADCTAWEQFVYNYNGGGTGTLFMQYWVLDYNGAACPSGWTGLSSNYYCYVSSQGTVVNALTAADLATVSFTGSAVSGGNDAVTMSVASGQATTVTAPDSVVDLASFWNTSEWGVYGDADGSEAFFGADNTLEAVTTLTSTSSSAPSCVQEGFTGETNNLDLTATPALGTESSPTMASTQTSGSTSSASCAAAAGTGGSTYQALPGTWSQCAAENGTCAVGSSSVIAFGAAGHFNYTSASSATACTDAVFGDPDVGVVKACYAQAAPGASNVWTQCAAENSTCSYGGVMTIAFGANGDYKYATLGSGGTACTDSVFGDPDVGTVKACYVIGAPPSFTTWTTCTAENGTCSFSGTQEVAFGANGQYYYSEVTGGTACNDGVFGDPDVGTVKACYIQ